MEHTNALKLKSDGIVRDPVNDKTTLEGAKRLLASFHWRDVFSDPNLQAIIEKTFNKQS